MILKKAPGINSKPQSAVVSYVHRVDYRPRGQSHQKCTSGQTSIKKNITLSCYGTQATYIACT